MTGFGRGEAEADGAHVTCEMRSVNGKGLDVRLRMPNRLDRLEPMLRKSVREQLARGNVQASVDVDRAHGQVRLRIDDAALDRMVEMARDATQRHGLAMPDLGAFLAMRGVVEAEEIEDDEEGLERAVRSAFVTALGALVDDRAREGEAIALMLRERIDAIETLTALAEADPSREPGTIRARLVDRLAHVADVELDPDRLHAEAALLAVRADLSEEIDRLRAHIEAARGLLASDGPAGRQLEFLAQEFAREANTLCAKSNAASLTAIGLELKVVIDQYREQVANVE